MRLRRLRLTSHSPGKAGNILASSLGFIKAANLGCALDAPGDVGVCARRPVEGVVALGVTTRGSSAGSGGGDGEARRGDTEPPRDWAVRMAPSGTRTRVAVPARLRAPMRGGSGLSPLVRGRWMR